MAEQNNQQQANVRTAAILATTKTLGWRFITEDINEGLQKAVQEALDEEDREKRDYLVVKAKAMQQVFQDFFKKLTVMQQFEESSPAFEEFEIA